MEKRKIVLAFAMLCAVAPAQLGLAEPAPIAQPDYSALTARSTALTPAQHAQAKQLFATSFSLWQSGDFAAAEIGFKQGLDIDPANALANYYYGDCLARRKDKAEAKDYLARAVAFGGTTAEGLKAQAELQALSVAPTSLSDMTPDELKAAYVGTWSGQLIGAGWGKDTDPIEFTITAVTGNQLTLIGHRPASLSKLDRGTIAGDHIQIVVEHSLKADQVLDGHLLSPTHIEGFIVAWGPYGGKWSVDKQ